MQLDSDLILDKLQKEADGFIGDIPQTYNGLELITNSSESIPMLIDPLIPRVGMFALVGSSDVAKSMILRQMAISCVRDDRFLDFYIDSIHKKAIVIATEDDQKAIGYLLNRQSKGDFRELERIRFYFESENIPQYLEEQLKADPADLVIIDAWSDVFGQNLNDSALIRQTLNIYKSIANKYQCAIGFLHHTGKRTQKLAPSKDNILSGQGFEAKMRLVMELRLDNREDNLRHLCVVKGNYLPREMKRASYVLEFDEETFTFSNTGDRVDFEELATTSDESKPQQQKLLGPHEVDKNTHIDILKRIFDGGRQLKLGELETRLGNKYEETFGTKFGGKRVRAYLDYLRYDLKLIGKEGEDRSPKAYYYLTGDHPLDTVMS